jgi:hypothetical protein
VGQLARLSPRYKLPLLILLAAWLGYLVLATPGTVTVQLPNNKGSVTMPRSLEGWQLTPGHGDFLLSGHTRMGLMQLQIEETNIPVGGNLAAYITERHNTGWKVEHDYQVRLKGELRAFGSYRLPVGRAVLDGKFLGRKVRMVQYDAYMQSDWKYVRVGFTFPEFLDDYLTPDQLFLADNIKLTK